MWKRDREPIDRLILKVLQETVLLVEFSHTAIDKMHTNTNNIPNKAYDRRESRWAEETHFLWDEHVFST